MRHDATFPQSPELNDLKCTFLRNPLFTFVFLLILVLFGPCARIKGKGNGGEGRRFWFLITNSFFLG